jgi:hypothetical protein
MIAKHIPMNAVKKSSFASLVSYLTGKQDKHERTGQVRATNCEGDGLEVATLEVLNTQALNTRSLADKTYHLIISFRDGEEPEKDTLAAIEDCICEGLGFTGHQRVSVVHHDTDNVHMHLAINKIHPSRYTIHEPFHAYRTLAKLCEKIEHDFHLQKDNHTARKVGAENRASDMEHHAGIESLLGWVQRECKERMLSAQSWEQLQAVLAENGLHLHPRANGLVITTSDGTTIKASSVAREFSKPRLEQRFGPFEPVPQRDAAHNPARRYDKKPLTARGDTSALYAKYQGVQAQVAAMRKRTLEQARTRKERRIEAAIRSVQLKRTAIRFAAMPRIAKNMAYNALTRALRREIAEIKRESRLERQRIGQQLHRRQWVDWLRHQAEAGDIRALAVLRGRKQARDANGNTIDGRCLAQRAANPSGQNSVTKKGTIIYRTGAGAVRDDGDKLKISIGADQATMRAALRMAIERYGSRIAVNGSDTFKEQIRAAALAENVSVTFDDSLLERRRRPLIGSTIRKSDADDNGFISGRERATNSEPGSPITGQTTAAQGTARLSNGEHQQEHMASASSVTKGVSRGAPPSWAEALPEHHDQMAIPEMEVATAKQLKGAQATVTSQERIRMKGRRR